MGVDCSCISVMCKVVAGAPWAEVAEEALMVANAADAILVPVLGESDLYMSYSISYRSMYMLVVALILLLG